MEKEVSSRFDAPAPVRQWIGAFNAHDVGAIVALYDEDAELFDSGMKYPRRGRRAIEQWFTSRFRSMPTITYTPTGVLHDDERAIITWTASGSTPRLLKQRWLSKPFKVDGVSVFRLRDGVIYEQRGYYDHLAMVERIFPFVGWLPVRL